MTTQRTAIFKPLGLELTRQMEAGGLFVVTPSPGATDVPPYCLRVLPITLREGPFDFRFSREGLRGVPK